MAAVDVATPVMVVLAKAEAMVTLMPTPHPNKDCVLHLIKTHLIMDTRQQLMKCKHHGRRLCNTLVQLMGKTLTIGTEAICTKQDCINCNVDKRLIATLAR